jgi:hypothetical protein
MIKVIENKLKIPARDRYTRINEIREKWLFQEKEYFQELPLTYPVLYGNIHSLNIGTFLPFPHLMRRFNL